MGGHSLGEDSRKQPQVLPARGRSRAPEHGLKHLRSVPSPGRRVDLDRTFSALSDPTRRAILEELASGEMTVGELAKPFSISLPAISKHLKVLEDAGLLKREKDGRMYRCVLDATQLIGPARWIARYSLLWREQLDELADYLKSDERGGKSG
ncbi:MAG: winged helix-turn-helix transcriptional regulator [Thaumarchaeota archaeon]|nr:MAG: winged helix-turn-helix transcriptional regulator [Nitrososphaerota archaeon]